MNRHSPMDLVRLPFLLAEKITSPVVEAVEATIGEEVQQIVRVVPGLNLLEDVCKGVNGWVKGDKLLPPKTGKDSEKD